MLSLFEPQTSNALKRSFIVGFVLSLPAIAFACYANGICGVGMAYCQPMAVAQPVMCNCPPSYGCGQYGCYRLRARASKNFRPSFGSRRESFDLAQQQLPFGQEPENELSMFNPLTEIRHQSRLPSGRSEPLTELDERRALALASPTAAELPEKAQAYRSPNEAFLECCMDRQLPDACLSKCNFNYYNKQALTAMYFRQDPCPLAAMKEMQFCAAQGRDHRACCVRNGVTTTLAGLKCLTFCDQRPGIITQLDLSYVPCFDRFENMKACFWQDIIRYFR